ncbi:hypothetical protein AB0F17_03005 [Nonomuraea sp. NPDC026600]|uniref:hypothetical protein n=1 Tax=Nonomuraea sp. NPDC026600 TaxID=3155363 RepID=UPI003409E0DD
MTPGEIVVRARLVRLYLTDRAAQRPIQEARRALEERATAALTAEERRYLRVALAKVVQRLTEPT